MTQMTHSVSVTVFTCVICVSSVVVMASDMYDVAELSSVQHPLQTQPA